MPGSSQLVVLIRSVVRVGLYSSVDADSELLLARSLSCWKPLADPSAHA